MEDVVAIADGGGVVAAGSTTTARVDVVAKRR
jgi:hypothetical protein